MELFLIFNSSILPIFAIVAVAFAYQRLFRPDIAQITNLSLMVFAPVFVFDVLVKSRITVEMLFRPMAFMAGLTAALMLIAQAAARALRASENERIALVLASSMINIGNFGLPLIYFTLGADAVGSSVLYFVAFSVPLSTIAIYISSPEKRVMAVLKDVVKIPLFHAMILALVFSQHEILLPSVLGKSIGLVGQAAIPLLIFILGLQLSTIRMSTSHIRFVVPAVVIRLAVSPLIAYALLRVIGIHGDEQTIAMIQTSAPPALLPLMYAIRFKRSPDLLAAMIFTSVLLSGISLTILINILS